MLSASEPRLAFPLPVQAVIKTSTAKSDMTTHSGDLFKVKSVCLCESFIIIVRMMVQKYKIKLKTIAIRRKKYNKR